MKAALLEKWSLLSSKFGALNNRERLMVFGASALVVYTTVNMLLISPLAISKQRLLSEISTDQSVISDLQQQVDLLNSKQPIDPNAHNKQHISALESELAAIDTAKNQLEITLISPDKMPELLRDLLAKNGKLKLIALNTLPTQYLLAQPTTTNLPTTQLALNQEGQQENPVFKHVVEITIEGRYLDLLDYVSTIEKMDWHVLWNNAELSTKTYPNNQLKLTVYTLSLDKAWLSI
ncbi:MAG: MSHA biogenesis protein MshJ [Methylotenera sp.]|uniref:MSHA biogenesis protein MshJ n=1 Tax=Methylotenera sp. TaxID=2051956 RepID=UPI00271D666D|nr:MSHA biogenesis protein MshJ [Methylotenera sp.]MDO9150384.1 MSHA biogenesis protein MshJ [Methylotenera sp.]